MPPLLSNERRGDVALVTLRRPEKRNALSIELRSELADAINALGADDDVGAVVLTGEGSAFCSGIDVTQFGGDPENRRRLVETSTAAFEAVSACQRPIIAAVNGPALAGGFVLALGCDIRIASPDATFGFPELPRGIPPSYAAARSTLPAALARDLALSARLLDADEALRLGVVREVSADCVNRALAVAVGIAAVPRAATLETKRRILLERERLYGFLWEEEMALFRKTLLGDEENGGR